MKKWPIIRHLRYFFLSASLARHVRRYSKQGYLPLAQKHDLDYLRDVWQGKK
jgi:hypothetical protein